MFLQQIMEKTFILDTKLGEFSKTELAGIYGKEKEKVDLAVATLLFVISPAEMYNKFKLTRKADAMLDARMFYPRPTQLPALVKLLDQYTASDSQNPLVKEYYKFSKQEVAAGLKLIKSDRAQGVDGVDRWFAAQSNTKPTSKPEPEPKLEPTPEPTPAPIPLKGPFKLDDKYNDKYPNVTGQEYEKLMSRPYTDFLDKPIDPENWNVFDIPDDDRTPKYPEDANASGALGNKDQNHYLYDDYLLYVVGLALGRNLSNRSEVFNESARSSVFLNELIKGKTPMYPGDVDINRAINEWNKAQTYSNTKSKMLKVDGEYKRYGSTFHRITNIPRYMQITPELAEIVRKNYKDDQADARAGTTDVKNLRTGPPRRTHNTSIQQHWVEYDLEVFAANLATLNKLGANDKLNNIKDPMLQLAMMGDPRQKRVAQFGEWDKVRFEVTATGYLGIYRNTVGTPDGKSGDSTALTLMDRALGLDQTALSKTLAHEMRHRAFHIIMAIPELRDAMPEDLRKGGVWWDSWGGMYDKSDDGATAEHAMLYVMDWGTQVPKRRMDFFNNGLFNTQDYPLSYWRNLYYEASQAVGEFLKKIAAKEITPENLNVVDPDNPERNKQRDIMNASLLKLTPGLAEMYRYIIETDQLDALEAVEDSYDSNTDLLSSLGEFAMKDGYQKILNSRMSELIGALKYGNFSKAYRTSIPRARKIVNKLEQKGPSQLIARNNYSHFTVMENLEHIKRTLRVQKRLIDDTEAALRLFKNIELLNPAVFRRKIKSGEIQPATFKEIKDILPYSLASKPDYNSGFVATDDAPKGQRPYIPKSKKDEK